VTSSSSEVPTSIILRRCALRPFRAADVASLVHHADDHEVWRSLRDRFPHPYTEEDAQSWIELVASYPEGTHFAVDVGGQAVGSIGLVPQTDVHRRSAEIGYWLGRDVWGRGIATEIVRAVTEHGFESLGLVRVFATVFANNPASGRVLEKAGYALEGRLRCSVIKDGVTMDSLLYARVAEAPRASRMPPTVDVPLSNPFSVFRRGTRR
jgi:ribosomal-protein-alanine N-acetyltransferase